MEPVQIGNILIDRDQLAQVDQSRIVRTVARENFLSGEITAAKRVCERPYVLSLIAVAMICVGLLTARGLVDWLIRGGTVYAQSIMMILLLPGGAWFLREAWRQAPMLVIQTRHGTQRLEFRSGPAKESLADLERATAQHGYALRRAPN